MNNIQKSMLAASVVASLALVTTLFAQNPQAPSTKSNDQITRENVDRMIEEGRQTFRFDTFGDEVFWGGALKLHQAVIGSALGGVGPGIPPRMALSVGLKVDVDALPASVREGIANGKVNLADPATTVALLQLNAVVGVTGFFDATGKVTSMGIQCSLCHSTVDDSFAPGIGRRRDGWANRDLNVGAIIALAPDLSLPAAMLGVDQATVRTVLNSWGPGKFDAELLLDGKGFRPDGKSAAVLIPPAFGLAGVNMGTWTGFGSATYWNAFVANLEMHGSGVFYDPRLDDATQFPVAKKARSFNVRSDADRITPKLAALQFYQLAIPAPQSVEKTNGFNFTAIRGLTLFNGKAQCSRCHVPPLFTEPGFNMHSAEEMGVDSFQSDRSPTKMYRTSPLGGLITHEKGGFFHDGRFATLSAVVDHYDNLLGTGLTGQEKADLIAYLRTL